MPFTIPAGANEELECTLECPRPGEFASQIHVYLDELNALREIVLNVQGTAHAK